METKNQINYAKDTLNGRCKLVTRPPYLKLHKFVHKIYVKKIKSLITKRLKKILIRPEPCR